MSINCGAGLWKRADSFLTGSKKYPASIANRSSRQGCEKQ